MISTSNYVARKFGVRAGMPGFIGLKLCPELQLMPGRYHKYKEESSRVAEIMTEYDSTFQSHSLDEFCLNLTEYLVKRCSLPDSKVKFECKQNENGDLILDDKVWQLADEIVQEIRQKVFDKVQLTCSAGISVNKLTAKICSDLKKPNGQCLLPASSSKDIINFIQKLNVKKIPGIGPVQQQTLAKAFEIETVEQLNQQLEVLCLVFSPNQIDYFTRVSLGISSFEMNFDEPAKSESRETTFNPTNDQKFLLKELLDCCENLSSSLIKHNCKGKTITLKIKKDSFQVNVKSKTIENYVNDSPSIFEIGKQLLLKEMREQENCRLRLIGIRLSNFQGENEDTSNQQIKIDDLFKRKIESSNLNSSNESNKDNSSNNSNDLDNQASDNQTNSNDFLCPVCSIRRYNELDQLNEHMDYCLSKQVIMSSVKEFSSNGNLDIASQNYQPFKSTSTSSKKRSNNNKVSRVDDEKESSKRKKITEYFNKL